MSRLGGDQYDIIEASNMRFSLFLSLSLALLLSLSITSTRKMLVVGDIYDVGRSSHRGYLDISSRITAEIRGIFEARRSRIIPGGPSEAEIELSLMYPS